MTTQNLIGGVHEIGVGVTDLEEAMTFWTAAGYRAEKTSSLSSEQAESLYGVKSGLTSRQLRHQHATSGLIRLMQWDAPTGPGLNMATLKTHGNRWSVHKTDDLLNAYIHGEVYRRQGNPIHLRAFQFNFNLGKKLEEKRPFLETLSANTDLLLFQLEAQYIIMTRINFDVTKYGTVNPQSLLRGSEGCHMALVIQGDDLAIFDFYDDVIGFKRGHSVEIAYQPGYMPSDMLELASDESFAEVDFNDPDAGEAPHEHLPGRLRCFLLRSPRKIDNRMARAQPGNLGYSLYTFRCRDITAMHKRVATSTATDITPIMADEFGTPAFAFTSPDGFQWLALAASP